MAWNEQVDKFMRVLDSANVGGKLGSVSGSVFTSSGVNFEKAKVKCDDFWDIARKSKANVNNSKGQISIKEIKAVIA